MIFNLFIYLMKNTLGKKILRSKEMYLIDSIYLYQTVRYPIQLNIFRSMKRVL